MHKFQISSYERKKAQYIVRLGALVDRVFAKARNTEWDSIQWKRYKKMQSKLEYTSYIFGMTAASDIVRELKDEMEQAEEIKKLQAQVDKLESLLTESKHYGEYMEYSSQSTDDQPRPEGWEYV